MAKLTGRQLYKSLGSPKTVMAPMVDHSEYAWRVFCRKYGAELCYTPMFNAKLFANNETYRKHNFGPLDGDPATDRPLIVQFCANDPDELLAAAKHVVGRCDAVDLNLGCPQGIARKGHYGAFLMDEWELVEQLISKLHNELEIPVTAKIRVFDTKEKTLEYAKRVVAAGAQILTVHGRTREMKGQNTGLADWSCIRYLRDNLPKDLVLFANGNIIYTSDVVRCLDETKADAVMSAETNLVNPAVFELGKTDTESLFPRVDRLAREYFEIARKCQDKTSIASLKSHLFKLLRTFFSHNTDIRNQLGPIRSGSFDEFNAIIEQVEARVQHSMQRFPDEVCFENGYHVVPHWRAQPLFRIVDGKVPHGRRDLETEERREKRRRLEDKAEDKAPPSEAEDKAPPSEAEEAQAKEDGDVLTAPLSEVEEAKVCG